MGRLSLKATGYLAGPCSQCSLPRQRQPHSASLAWVRRMWRRDVLVEHGDREGDHIVAGRVAQAALDQGMAHRADLRGLLAQRGRHIAGAVRGPGPHRGHGRQIGPLGVGRAGPSGHGRTRRRARTCASGAASSTSCRVIRFGALGHAPGPGLPNSCKKYGVALGERQRFFDRAVVPTTRPRLRPASANAWAAAPSSRLLMSTKLNSRSA